MAAPALTIVGRVRKAHGIHGEVVIEPLTDAPGAVFASGRRLYAGTTDGDPSPDGQELHVKGSRPFKEGWLVSFDEIDSRTNAERWRQRYVLAPPGELQPLADGQVYIHELIGLRVRLASGEGIGPITATFELPQGILLEVTRPEGSALIPFTADVVASIDRESGTMTVVLPEGMLE
jgi:16S rRNA processing protein RimM